jgi:hypothetical protein
MNKTQNIEDNVQAVCRPKELIRLLADDRVSKHEDYYHHDEEQHARQP